MVKHKKRLHRQFSAIGQVAPPTRGLIDALLHGRLRLVRLPIAIFLIIGGFVSILPVFGLWMLPLGLLLLAVDVPLLQPYVSNALIRIRRRFRVWTQSRKGG